MVGGAYETEDILPVFWDTAALHEALITCSVLVSRGGGGGWHRAVQKRWIPDMVVLV